MKIQTWVTIRNFSAISLTYYMSIVNCCNSHKDKWFWKCIHLLKKLLSTKRLCDCFAWNQYFLIFEWFPTIGQRFQESGISARWNVLMKRTRWVAGNTQFGYNGYNLIFHCYMLNREMINYSGVKIFSKH